MTTSSGISLSPPKEGADVRVGRELGDPMGFLMRRTKRVEELLAIPEVMDLAQRLVVHMDHYCDVEQVDPKELDVVVTPTRTLRYITLRFGAQPCIVCTGTGYVLDGRALCERCEGSGLRK